MQCKTLILAGSVMLTFAANPIPTRSAEDVAASLKRQSQEFSDASATGNAAVLARDLDDRVTFVNENGEIGTKKDLLSGVAPTPKGVSNRLLQTHWHVRLYGSVAVTSFTDESTVHFHGQTLKAAYLSTEVWAKEKGGWKMISSQTIALQNDPPAIALPKDVLDGYVGTYTAGAGYEVAIARRGDDLTAAVNGAKPVGWKAEVKDVFFVPGQPRVRRIFQRDPSGAIVGFVSRREGRDISLKRVG